MPELEMQSKICNRHSGMAIRSPISTLMFCMFSTLASFYVAGRLWQDAEYRVGSTKELDRITGQGHPVMSVEVALKFISCREQQKRLSELEMELAAARQDGYVSNNMLGKRKVSDRRPLVVIGVLTRFGRKNDRDAIRKAWMTTGRALKQMERDKGVIVRFIIGRSSNRGDDLDRTIDSENKQTDDFFILENHVEVPEDYPQKTKLFFSAAAANWDAYFFAKVNDDVFVNVDALGSILASYANNPRVYIGCMKSGEVFSEPNDKWHEPDSGKFGDGKKYFRHASGEMFVISQALAQFISINSHLLRTYAHDDVTVGSWLIGADARYVDENKFCCSSWSSGAICSGV